MIKDSKKKANKTVESGFKYYQFYLLLVLIIVALYGRSTGFEFTLDDDLYIVTNPTVQEGVKGIASTFTHGSMEFFKGSNFQIYRPVLISFFCFEKSLFGSRPAGYHFINILLYIFLAIIIFKLLCQLFRSINIYHLAAITLLFITHPIHTEVVASVKSQDELLAAIFNISALYFFCISIIKEEKGYKSLLKATLLYTFALFTKESAFAFVAIFPLTFLIIGKINFKKSLLTLLPIFSVALFFLIIRYFVLRNYHQVYETGVLENVLYGAKSLDVLLATKASILWYYIHLMFFPHSLSWDYSYNQIPLVTWSSAIPWVSVFSYLLIAFICIRNLKSNAFISFGFLFFLILISPTSNLFFLNGTTFAERFLFLPSLGFIISVFLIMLRLSQMNFTVQPKSGFKYYTVFVISVLLIFSVATVNRAGDWKNNFALFKSGVQSAPNSGRTTLCLGTLYMNLAETATDAALRFQYIDSAIVYLTRSVKIDPTNTYASYRLALIYSIKGENALSVEYYRLSISAKPDNLLALTNLGTLYSSINKPDSAFFYFKKSFELDSANQMTLANLTVISSVLNQYEDAIHYGELAVSQGLGNNKIYSVLSAVYSKKNDSVKADYYQKLSNSSILN